LIKKQSPNVLHFVLFYIAASLAGSLFVLRWWWDLTGSNDGIMCVDGKEKVFNCSRMMDLEFWVSRINAS
jgi:hypothetical protein